jgi:hypothetical protein
MALNTHRPTLFLSYWQVQADDVAMQLMPLTAIRRRKGATAKRADVDEVIVD